MPFRRIAVLVLVLAAVLPGHVLAADDFDTARQLHRKGERTEALEMLDRHLERQPRDARARFLKGVILSEENRRADAIAVFESLTQDFPELAEPYNNLAVLYAGKGDYERARETLEMAVRANPDYAIAHENLGDIHAALARQQYEKAAALDKKNQSARAKLTAVQDLLAAKPAAHASASGTATASAARAPAAVTSPAGASSPAAAPTTSGNAAGDAGKLDAQSEPPALSAAGEMTTADSLAERSPPPVPEPPAPPGPYQSVLRMLDDWAAAWSMRDANAYLSYYATDFRPARNEPRAKWEAARRAELAKARDAAVKITAPQVTFRDAQHATATFRQDYVSGTRKGVRKTLELVQSSGRWLIQRETTAQP
jgi:tetratricopeptide (TPR) repeat protein